MFYVDKYHTIHMQTVDQYDRLSMTCDGLQFIAFNVFGEETFAYAVTNIFVSDNLYPR